MIYPVFTSEKIASVHINNNVNRLRRFNFAMTHISHSPQPDYTLESGLVFNRLKSLDVMSGVDLKNFTDDKYSNVVEQCNVVRLHHFFGFENTEP